MTRRRHVLVAGERDRLTGSNPGDDCRDGRTLVGEHVAFVSIEQCIVIGLRLQALTFD